jgi:hypothetical protein
MTYTKPSIAAMLQLEAELQLRAFSGKQTDDIDSLNQ